ncbi:hypothetical protein D3C76_1353190 [compost metagenome]
MVGKQVGVTLQVFLEQLQKTAGLLTVVFKRVLRVAVGVLVVVQVHLEDLVVFVDQTLCQLRSVR